MTSHDATSSVTVRRLTPNNVDALRRMLSAADATRLVDVDATVATFHMPALDAVRLVRRLIDRAAVDHGTRGHPTQSLHAVLRKLREQARAGA